LQSSSLDSREKESSRLEEGELDSSLLDREELELSMTVPSFFPMAVSGAEVEFQRNSPSSSLTFKRLHLTVGRLMFRSEREGRGEGSTALGEGGGEEE